MAALLERERALVVRQQESSRIIREQSASLQLEHEKTQALHALLAALREELALAAAASDSSMEMCRYTSGLETHRVESSI